MEQTLQDTPNDKDLINIALLFIEWLQIHRKAYNHHKNFIDLITKEIKDEVGDYKTVLDESPPDFDSKDWQKVSVEYFNESKKGEKIYRQLIEKTDIYLAKKALQ